MNVEWCSFCNSRPADGNLTVLDTITNKTLVLPACASCVTAIPQEDWIDEKEAPC